MSNPAEYSQEHNTFVEETNRVARIEAGVSRILENSKVKHQDDRATAVRSVIAKLQSSGVTFRVADRGWVVPERNGQPQNLQSLVENLLLTDKALGDPASIQSAVAEGELSVKSKSDLTTVAQKTTFINKYGYDTWAKLPQHRIAPINMQPETMGRNDYNRLTVQQRIDFQKTINEAQLGQILRRT
jgi:hypothetical protein